MEATSWALWEWELSEGWTISIALDFPGSRQWQDTDGKPSSVLSAKEQTLNRDITLTTGTCSLYHLTTSISLPWHPPIFKAKSWKSNAQWAFPRSLYLFLSMYLTFSFLSSIFLPGLHHPLSVSPSLSFPGPSCSLGLLSSSFNLGVTQLSPILCPPPCCDS